MDKAQVTIIGAGVVGLAIAAEVANHCDSVIVAERHAAFGQETSSRNSEVIHSGIYYPQGSLKAGLCVEGARLLYELCACHAIPCKKTGKLIVASSSDEIPTLEQLLKKGLANNVQNLVILDKQETLKKEPNVLAEAALYSPDTGIIDSHALMKHFYQAAVMKGALFAWNSEVASLEKYHDGFVVGIKQDNYRFQSRVVINCAGLSADCVAGFAGIDVRQASYDHKFCKGSYFSYAKPSPVKMLVYPVPHEHLVGLGVHATLDLGGRLRFGPDAEYIDRTLDYGVDAGKRGSFYRGASQIIAGIEEESLCPDMAGIRPKLQGPGDGVKDFIIREERDKNMEGFINLIGIESPGLTSSPAIAKKVSGMVAALLK